MGNILDTLRRQHKTVRQLFEKIESSKDNGEKEKLFLELRNILVPHIRGEEKYFFPVLEQKQSSKEAVLHGLEEHHAAKLFIKELEGMSPTSERWEAKVGVLKDMVEHHVESEESKIFKAARESLSEEQMKEIGDKLEDSSPKGNLGRLTRVT